VQIPRDARVVDEPDRLPRAPAVVPVKQGGLRSVSGEVDWYVFTSPSGEQWLVEGVREGLVKTADYRGKPRPM